VRNSTILLSLVALAVLALASGVAAQDEGWRADDRGLVISAERLFGLHLHVAATDYANGSGTATSTTFMTNFLWANATAADQGLNLHAMPHVGLHGVIGPGLTVGGSVGFFSHTGEFEQDVGDIEGSSVDLPSQFGVVFAPRFGAILPVSRVLAFWPRGGLTLHNVSTTIPGSSVTEEFTTNEFGMALSFDPMLVFTPVPHVGLLLGPTIDVGLSGSVENDRDGRVIDDTIGDDKPTLRHSNFGLVLGLAVFL
jgi:hypothetical protein